VTPKPRNPSSFIYYVAENCHPSASLPGYDVVNAIRRIGLGYGAIKLFKAYLALSEQYSSRSATLYSELQASGISLTDCPHNGRKDVADKMIIGENTHIRKSNKTEVD
jgi:hypothetical protein